MYIKPVLLNIIYIISGLPTMMLEDKCVSVLTGMFFSRTLLRSCNNTVGRNCFKHIHF